MTAQDGGWIWYELMTTDPDGAAAFYGSVVGWTIAGTADPQAGGLDYRPIMRKDGGSNGGVLGLTKEMCEHGAKPCWLGYLHVRDVDSAVEAIVGDGGQVVMPKAVLPVGSIAMVTDPQGVPFYVMSPVPPPDKPDAKSDVYDRFAVQHVSWNELFTPDLAGAKDFYARHFGFAFNQSMPMGPELGDYCFIDHGSEGIGAVMKTPPHGRAGWNFYIRVADIDAARAAVEENGGQVLHGPSEVPGGDWVVNGIDPQGAAFALVGARQVG